MTVFMLLITGVTGLTGRLLLDELRLAGYREKVRCLVRKSSDTSWIHDDLVELCIGDVNDYSSIKRCLRDVSSVIHLVNIRSSPQIIQACQEASIQRVIFVNTTGMFSKYQEYAAEYQKLEVGILNCALDYTIIRPTMIYGSQQDKNIHKLVKIVDRFPVVPFVASKYGLMQPIFARDLARVITSAFLNPISIRRAYNVAGQQAIHLSKILRLTAAQLGKKRLFIAVPYPMALAAAYVGEIVPNGLIDVEKVRRLLEDKTFSYEEAARDLGFSPITFEEGLELEIASLQTAGII